MVALQGYMRVSCCASDYQRERTMSLHSCKKNPIQIIGSDLQGDGSDQSRKTKSLIQVDTE